MASIDISTLPALLPLLFGAITTGGSADSVEMLEEGRIHHGTPEISSRNTLLKTYNLFISGIFHLVFLDHGWPQVTN